MILRTKWLKATLNNSNAMNIFSLSVCFILVYKVGYLYIASCYYFTLPICIVCCVIFSLLTAMLLPNTALKAVPNRDISLSCFRLNTSMARVGGVGRRGCVVPLADVGDIFLSFKISMLLHCLLYAIGNYCRFTSRVCRPRFPIVN